MDYPSIYTRFIADRRGKEASLTGYSEKHHIVPRSMGGGDDPDNLVALIPEDHFFAHLLLAKIHGGRMWAVVAFMIGGSKHWRPTQFRKRYGWTKRALSKALSGEGAHQFDHVMHRLRHLDGREWCGKQITMPDVGLSPSLANMLIKGRVKCAKGWYLADTPTPSRSGVNHPMYRSEVHEFVHVDGRSFAGTQFDFHKSQGISKPAASNLARGKVKVWNGWHLKGATLPNLGRASRWSRLARSRT